MVSGRVVEVEPAFKLTEAVRRRCVFLQHLPLHTEVTFVELDLAERYLSPATVAAFAHRFDERRRARGARARAEARERQRDRARERRAAEERRAKDRREFGVAPSARERHRDWAPPTTTATAIAAASTAPSSSSSSSSTQQASTPAAAAPPASSSDAASGRDESGGGSLKPLPESAAGPGDDGADDALGSYDPGESGGGGTRASATGFSFSSVTSLALTANERHFPGLGAATAPTNGSGGMSRGGRPASSPLLRPSRWAPSASPAAGAPSPLMQSLSLAGASSSGSGSGSGNDGAEHGQQQSDQQPPSVRKKSSKKGKTLLSTTGMGRRY